MDLDGILSDVGEFGRYQKLVLWFILVPGVFPCGFHAYNQLFMAANAEHWCRIPELEHLDLEIAKNISIPLEEKDGKWTYSQCLMYDKNYTDISDPFGEIGNFTTSQKVPCRNGWVYDRSQHKNSVTMEWNLVCAKDISATLALVLLGLGGLVGNYIFGYVQDGLGRKPSFFIYLFIQSVFGIATAFASNFFMWSIFRIGVGFTVPAILATPCVLVEEQPSQPATPSAKKPEPGPASSIKHPKLGPSNSPSQTKESKIKWTLLSAIELVGPKHRTTVTIMINIAYSLSLITLSVIVWAVRDWRQLAIITTLPFLPLFCLYPLLPESPRWLVSQGEFDKAEAILTTMAKNNGKHLQASSMANLKRIREEEKTKAKYQKSYGVWDLFKSPNLRWKTIIITFIWFTNTSVYVGLSYYAPVLGGDEFLNFFLAGAVELPTYLFLWPAMERWGRRWTLCVSMVIGGSACLATFLVKHDSAVTLALYCIGKMGISSSFVVLPLMASELYPTVVRGLGMSISSVMGMLGPVFIPLVNYLGSDMLTLPLIIMGSLLVAGGICSLLLPETLNQNLPQTLEDGEKAGLDCFACCTPPQSSMKIAVVHESVV